jgi:citrate lyase subunit beta / citryl-CoA lyase
MSSTQRSTLITGAGGELGSAIARRFAATGHPVLCLDREEAAARRAAAALSSAATEATSHGLDITDESAVVFAADLVHSGAGQVLDIGSIAATIGYRFRAYTASKAARINLTRALVPAFWGPRSPPTQFARGDGHPDARPVGRRGLPAKDPHRRVVNPDEIAAPCAYFVSEGAASINGQSVVIDGGATSGFPLHRRGALMKPFRSLLFVPGHKPSWADKAIRAGAHALILDLEDAVPASAKEEGRAAVAATIDRLADGPAGLLVRVNPLYTDLFGKDIAAVVRCGLTALLLPKVYGRDDIVAFDALVTAAEIERGLPRGSVGLIPSLETARSLSHVDAIATAPRVVSLMAAAAKDADISREVGFRWSAAGLETLYLRSKVVLAARSAGLNHVVLGLWQDVQDLQGLRAFAEANRDLGFGGQVLIHPSHVSTVNKIYTPSDAELERLRRLIAAYEHGVRQGQGAVTFDGEHIDLAHAQSAKFILASAGQTERDH